MTYDQFEGVMKKWLDYWEEPALSEVQVKERWISFGSWPEARLESAFIRWKTKGKRWPTESHLNESDRTNRIEYMDSRRGQLEHPELNATREHCERLFEAAIGFRGNITSDYKTLIPTKEIVDKAVDFYENHDPEPWHDDRTAKRSAMAAGYSCIHLEVLARMKGMSA